MKIINNVSLHDEYVSIEIVSSNYKHTMLLDTEDLYAIGKVRVSNTGYAYTCKGGHSVAHVVMKHTSNMKTVVDHVNGNRLDNRKCNLRVVTQADNSRNKSTFVRNNTGTVGIAYRETGKYAYYRVSLVDKRETSINPTNGKKYSKRVTKQFNINKLGKEAAFALATEYLNNMKVVLGY